MLLVMHTCPRANQKCIEVLASTLKYMEVFIIERNVIQGCAILCQLRLLSDFAKHFIS